MFGPDSPAYRQLRPFENKGKSGLLPEPVKPFSKQVNCPF